jgi:hypothetical protein
MAEWNVGKTAGTCCVTQKQLVENEEHYSALFETNEGFERRDYCLEAWAGPPDEAICFWKARVPAKEEKKRMFVDDDVLMNFFMRLADAEDPLKLNFRFVLGLILMRKRLLKYEQTVREDNAEFWVMQFVKDKTPHRVLNPSLDDAQIREVSGQLTAILHGDMGHFDEFDADSDADLPDEAADQSDNTAPEDSETEAPQTAES